MNLDELFQQEGMGVMATAASDGTVNTAVYARPHRGGNGELVWGMTEGQTWRNLRENPHASFLFRTEGRGWTGARIKLKLMEIRDSGELLQRIKQEAARVVSPQAAEAVCHAGYFQVEEVRALI
jgi:predicted pyridoxine 5'-phosphate oxidase superfamily flavin-nucleotide-binding protein